MFCHTARLRNRPARLKLVFSDSTIAAVCVPFIGVSAIDAVIQLADWPEEPIEDFIQQAFAVSDVVGIINDPCVSTDLRGRAESVVIALPELHTVSARQIRILGWYDNELGFSACMLDMAERMSDLKK